MTAERRRTSYRVLDQTNPLIPYALLLPHAIFFVAFIIYPLLRGFVISLQRWDPLRDDVPFVGLAHYARLLDPASAQFQKFWSSLGNTLFFVAVTTPLLVALALLLAFLLHRKIRGRGFMRSAFFLPTILSVSVVSILFRWMFADRIGLVPAMLADLGISMPSVLTTRWLAWIPIVLATVWWQVGTNMMLYLAGLAGISESYNEAAAVDGANTWQRVRHITLPLLMPTTLFVSVTTILNQFQMFGQSDLITDGGPAESTTTTIMYITTEAFLNNQLSSATAMSFVFGLVMLIVTAVQFRAMTRDISKPGA